LGLISEETGFRYWQGAKVRKPSQITATPQLAIRLSGVTEWAQLRLADYDRQIVVNDGKKQARAVIPSEKWLKAREAEMNEINTHLSQANFHGALTGIVHLADVPGSIADLMMTPHHRTVRRIFNGNFESGGRIFGGWWETLERQRRFTCMRINGESVANVDYSNLFLRLCYAHSKVQPPAGDLYDLSGIDHRREDWPELRDGRKKLVNAIIFNIGELKYWPGKTSQERATVKACFPEGTPLRAEVQAIGERHRAIAGEWFETGRGLELMRTESDLLVAVLLRLIRIGVTALPLHDSVIVAGSDALLAKRAMEDVAEMLIGTLIPVKIETGQDCGAIPACSPL
jgi:hypothetical protein